MMSRKLLLLLIACFSISYAYSQNDLFGISAAKQMHAKLKKIQPKGGQGQLVFHTDYILQYSEPDEQASWVLYELTKTEVEKPLKRTDDFRDDPLVRTESASIDDYAKSGYDRGHLAPAADMHDSQKIMSESFFMSNMSPQKPKFNRGIWRMLEEQVRVWAIENNKIFVVTGPVLNEGPYDSIGENRVIVPKRYFKVIWVDKAGEDQDKMIAFLMNNEGSQEPLEKFVVSTDEVESATGLDFFPSINDELEARLESNTDASQWNFKKTKKKKQKTSIKEKETSAKKIPAQGVQCKGISKSSGKRCKKHTKDPSGYCHFHQNQIK